MCRRDSAWVAGSHKLWKSGADVFLSKDGETFKAVSYTHLDVYKRQVQTKNGNTFYIVIDYDAPINEDEEQYQTYFLNMVDESDLLALLDEDTAAALTTCNCKEKCAAGSCV